MTPAPIGDRTVYPVGIVGVGNMGGAMAANLLQRGWPVHVLDLDTSIFQFYLFNLTTCFS